ncbi:MAG: cell division protein SepF [Armatimonadetes bacterium]|nr:cell division protein SepF [Armatimonadota bacterium]
MDELHEVERPGFFARLFGRRHPDEYDEFDEMDDHPDQGAKLRVFTTHTYHVTVRRQVVTFADGVASADGLKRGEQQILNLCSADTTLREKIKDFLAGVNYAQEGTWEELGEHVYLLAPKNAIVETAPATPRMSAATN